MPPSSSYPALKNQQEASKHRKQHGDRPIEQTDGAGPSNHDRARAIQRQEPALPPRSPALYIFIPSLAGWLAPSASDVVA
jgi:hypothetical protein